MRPRIPGVRTTDRGCSSESARELRVQVRLERDPEVALHRMDRDSALGRERADRVAVADVQANVLIGPPDDEVAFPWVRLADAATIPETVVVGRDAAIPADPI